MSIADELSKLEDLRRRGVLSESEFAQAKAAVLAGTDAPADSASEHLAEHLADVRQQNDLARLDREWQMEREQYLVAGRRGVRHVPTTGASLAGAGVVGVFGVFWTIFAFAITSSAPS